MTRWHLFWIFIFVAATGLVIYTPRCRGGAVSTTISPSAVAFNKGRAWKDLVHQVMAGYRIPGTPVHREVRDWLVKELASSADVVTTQAFTHRLGGRDVTMWNIIASVPGTNASAQPPVLLAAHWDSRPTADKDPTPANQKMPIDGANDGASGVAVLLEIARQLKAHPAPHDVVIVLFDGEDYGPDIDNMLLGSQFYATHLPSIKPSWGVLLDMIGDKDLAIYREPNSDIAAKEVNDRIFRAARALGYLGSPGVSGFIDKPYKYAIDDDHMALIRAGVPMVDLIDFDYPAWHTRQDTVSQCSPESLYLVGKTILYALQSK